MSGVVIETVDGEMETAAWVTLKQHLKSHLLHYQLHYLSNENAWQGEQPKSTMKRGREKQ